MTLTDPIADLLTRIRNAQKAGRNGCSAPWSTLKEELLSVLKREGWIADVRVIGEAPRREIEVDFHPEKLHLTLKRISRPGRRTYAHAKDLQPILSGFGTAILTTSQGLMTDKEARNKRVGGEVLCTIS